MKLPTGAPVRAAIFDLDGTLLDTLEDIASAMDYALQQHGLAPHTLDEYRQFIGEGVRTLVRRAMGEIEHARHRRALVPVMGGLQGGDGEKTRHGHFPLRAAVAGSILARSASQARVRRASSSSHFRKRWILGLAAASAFTVTHQS